jgi:hypothetical protein
MDNFTTGEMEADAGGPSVSAQESIGASYKIVTTVPGSRGAHVQQRSDYLMPSVKGRNGSTEKVDPAIVQTPLGGMMPGPNAIAPAIPSGSVGAATFVPNEDKGFGAGVLDGYTEGCPVPFR